VRPDITLYTSNNCHACEAAKQWLKHHGVDIIVINLNDHENEAARLARMGLLSVPILQVGDEYLVGFQPAKWAEMVKSRAKEVQDAN
jgi:glutaredoxin